jgi:hypothetical protein
LNNLRGFLGLNGYYNNFVHNYGRIESSLMTLTKKDVVSWNTEENQGFEQLKQTMCKALILSTPNFTKTFIVECNALGNGIGVVLMK